MKAVHCVVLYFKMGFKIVILIIIPIFTKYVSNLLFFMYPTYVTLYAEN